MDELAAIEARMSSGRSFTYAQLCQHGDDRLADKTIQKWRRRGLIAFVRVGSSPVWSLTELGRQKFNIEEKA